MHRVAIIQPSYIPWRGFFDILHSVDVFVHLDDVQYTARDWRSRNRVRQAGAASQWLTVPVLAERGQRLDTVRIDYSQAWPRKHLATLRQTYAKMPHFSTYFAQLEAIYQAAPPLLVDLDIQLTERIAGWLGLRPRFVRASAFGVEGVKDTRLIALVRAVGGDVYLSGPSAKDYIQPQLWQDAGIALAWADYAGYPPYPQVAGEFDPFVSVLDLLFAVGPEAPAYIWGARRAAAQP